MGLCFSLLLLGLQLWLNGRAYRGPGLTTVPSGAEVRVFRTGGRLSAAGGFSGLTEEIALGHSPGPLPLSQADMPARLILRLPGYQDNEVKITSWPPPEPIRLSPKFPLTPLYYSLLRTPGWWGLALLLGTALSTLWNRRLQQRLQQATAIRLAQGELRPGDRVADYTVERVLGRGGMGSVYLAYSSSGQPVALKILRTSSRFQEEARTYQKLRHPNLVFLLDWGQVHGQLYLALEFIAGETLASLIQKGQPIELSRLLADLLSALTELQRLGIVHRDLKPDNVMIQNGRARLLDFGIAQSSGEASSAGTPGYSAPEQLRGQPVDARADLYALGALLYHAASGRPPFPGATPAQILKLQSEGTFEPLQGPHAALIHSLLQPDPNGRPSGPAELQE